MDVEAPLLRLLLCEWAAANRDGTFTIIRGGIDNWETPLPLNLGREASLFMFVEIQGGALTEGDHEFSCSVLVPNGIKAAEAAGRLRIVQPTSVTRVVLPLGASIQSYGVCQVRFELGPLVASAPLDVRPQGNT